MTLAAMYHRDRDALLCDLAETYHIYDFKALPVMQLAALACGLREDSRIKMKMVGMKYIPDFVLTAVAVDKIASILYVLTAKEGDPEPTRFFDMVMEGEPKEESQFGFMSGEEFEKEKQRILSEVRKHG